MLPSKDLVVYFLLSLVFINDARCQETDKMSEILDEILVNIHRISRQTQDHEDVSSIWQKYEFGTGAGNREDVVVTNISTHKFADMSESNQWLVMQTGATYFIRTENSTLFFYETNLEDLSIKLVLRVKTEGHILQFKILNLNIDETISTNDTNNLMAVLFVKQENSYCLYWYRIVGITYTLYSIMPIQKQIQDLEFVREEGQHELLLLDNDSHFEDKSLIDIYGFDVNYKDHRIDIWFCRRLFVPKILDVQFCPISGRTVLAFRRVDSVVLYEAKKEDKLCQFEEFQVIKSNKLANFICFESGYIHYLAIGGQEPRLLHFSESEFQDNGETNLHFGDIIWITAVPINTYRDESLLLIQLRNSTVIALAWHGSKFKAVPLPNEILNTFDLSKAIVIPKVGFMYTNTLVRIEVNLKELMHPIHNEMESMLKTRALLEEIFRKQETIFDETEALLNQSYLNNPEITGFWNLSEVNTSSATIGRNVHYNTVKVGLVEMRIEDIKANITSITKRLEEIDAKLDEIYELKNSSNEIVLPLDIEITGNFIIDGTLYVNNLNATYINKVSDPSTVNDIATHADIINVKNFSSIDVRNLTVHFVNDIPVEDIVFDTTIKNYSDIEFSKLKRLKVEGHLNFSKINDITWDDLMENIIWKNKAAIIPGETVIEGRLIAEDVNIENLNHLQYSNDYVLNNSPFVEITGEKYFANLSTTHLKNITTINGISIDDFIIVSRDEVLDKEITFENLKVDGTFTIDGNVTGLNISTESLLNETDTLLSDVIFENLTIMGNIVLEDSIDDKTWSDLDDLLLRTEESAEIVGSKTFLNSVTIKSSFSVETINDHLFTDLVTLDTKQDFPYLEKISANITFGNVTLNCVQSLHNHILKDYINHEQGDYSGCLNTVLLFAKSVIVENLSFKTLKQTISQISFFENLNRTFQNTYLKNLTISTLTADEIFPKIVNGINYTELAEHVITTSTQQNLTGILTMNNLKTDILDVKLVNKMSLNELKQLLIHAQSLYDDIFNNNTPINSLQVTGMITASSINGDNILNIFDEDNMATVIFNKTVSIEDLTVNGLVNGVNFSEFVSDAVRKSDRNVTFTGFKVFENVTCEGLEMRFINGHSVDDILTADKEQVLKGPIVVNGSVTVLRTFNTTGKVGNVFFRDFADRFEFLGNNSYALRGNVSFTETASITELDVSGRIQGVIFDKFLEKTISKNDTNVTISGSKVFKNLVTFKGLFTIDGSLNDVDLYSFQKGAVYIDKPFSINSTVIFKKDVHIQKDLVVKRELQSNTIRGVNIKELQDNAITLNKPTYIPARMTLNNATFQANIKVTQINDLEMDLLIPLHTKQLIIIDWLNGTNVTVKHFDLSGRVNTYDLKNIFEDTFMIYGNQDITGNIKILGNVYALRNFDAHRINNVNPKQYISLITNETLTGNFIFKSPVILDKSLRILGSLNGIKPINWLGAAIKRTEKAIQIISGKWRIHGNVRFEGNIKGSEFLNEINITKTSFALAEDLPKIDGVIKEEDDDIHKLCVLTLNRFKCNAVNQIYKFNTFNYLKVLEFEGDIHDIYNIEVNDTNYMLVNYDCSVKLILYNQTDFQVINKIPDFGLIDRWMVFKSNHSLFLLTIAKRTCGRSLNNIWKLESNRLTHILELGNIADMDLSREEVVSMINKNFATAPENIQSDILEAITLFENKKLNVILNNDSIVQSPQSLMYELEENSSNDTNLTTSLDHDIILKFRVGIYQKEEYIYYNEELSPHYIYIYKNEISQTKILQVIKAHRPRSIKILNFPGFVETLLIFVENSDIVRIYEYRGIEGFVESNAMHLKVDKLHHFKIRKYANMEKRYCLAAVYKNRLTILEATMHGEKLDLKIMESLKMDSVINSCFWNTCSVD